MLPAFTARAWRRGAHFALWLAAAATPILAQQNATLTEERWTKPPEPIAKAVLAPRHLNVSLSNPSPDNRYFIDQESAGLPSMATFAKPHLWLGGLQVDPVANRARTFTTRGARGLSVTEWESGRHIDVQVPRGATVSAPRWSPDGTKLAYFANFDDATHIFVADMPSGRSRQITRTPVLATLNTTFDWTSDGKRLVTVLVPQNRGAAPQAPAVPTGPQVKLTSEGENRVPTYRSLMGWPHEKELLEYYTTGQLALIDVDARTERRVGQPAMIRSVDIAPNGEYLNVTTMQKPFSYIAPVSNFGTKSEIWSVDGRVLAKVTERPINEGLRAGNVPANQVQGQSAEDANAMRNVMWRPDGAGLSYLQQEPETPRDTTQAQPPESDRPAARRKDRLMLWAPPFDENSKRVVYESDTRMTSVSYAADAQTLFVTETSGSNTHVYAVRLSEPTKKLTIARSRTDEFYNAPGTLLTTRGPLGGTVVRMSPDGNAVFLWGTKYYEKPHEQAPREFIDRVDVNTGAKTRIYEADNVNATERIDAVLDDNVSRFIVTRESPTQVPDSYVRDASGALRKLTSNRDYNPEITNAQRRRITVRRADGFDFKVDVTLPPDYRAGTRLPAMFWFYPREYTGQEPYDRTLRTYNKNRFPNVGVRSMEFLTMLGYAVVAPDAPIIGADGRMNDNYEHDLRNNLAAVIDALDKEGIIDRERLGVGGHSYGAFSTVNAMVHTPFFKAGIAGDGAYNRTLTPMGFQTERRDLYQGRETYLAMSPILYANNLTGALLMYHGIDDQNVGTDPINATRLFHVLNGLGKTASLYMYPYEDHGPATEETILDLWARWTAWLDQYVKNPPKKDAKVTTN